MSVSLLPIPFLPHEAAHVAAHDSGLLWRAIDPQPPAWVSDRGSWIHTNGAGTGVFWTDRLPPDPGDACFWPEGKGEVAHFPYQPGALYYAQERYVDILEEDRPDGTPNVVYAAHQFDSSADNVGVDRDGRPRSIVEWRPTPTMPPGLARFIIEITRVEVKQARNVSPMDHLLCGVEFSYVGNDQREVRARRFHQLYEAPPDAWGFLYHYTVKERR